MYYMLSGKYYRSRWGTDAGADVVVLKAYTIPLETIMARQSQIPRIFLEVAFLVYKDK
jgi:hypothetical protein